MVHRVYWIINVWSVWHICLFQWSSCINCPSPCTCREEIFQKIVNCSGLGASPRELNTIFTNLPPQTANLYLFKMDTYQFPEGHQLFLPALKTLYITSGELSTLHDGLRFLSASVKANLSFLNLSDNKVNTLLPDDFLNFTSLQFLDLRYNGLKKIFSNSFADLPSLRELDLSNNPLGNQLRNAKIFNGLHNLVTLKLSNCSIQFVHAKVFSHLQSLEYLHVEDNLLRSLPVKALSLMPLLKGLFAKDNHISEIHSETANLRRLTSLDLSRNNLSKIHPSAFSGCENLRELYIDNNRLQTLPTELNVPFFYLDKTNLMENSWVCDCHLIWLRRWISNQTSTFFSPTCTWPHSIALKNIHLDDMRCPTEQAYLQKQCKVNSWSGVQDCPLCPPFSHVTEAGSDCVCLPGYTANSSGECFACPVGFYKQASGHGPCVPCQEGSTTFHPGSSRCICAPGWTFTRGKCRECERNSYKTQYGLHDCLPCEGNTLSPEGSTRPDMCQCQDGGQRGLRTVCKPPRPVYRGTEHMSVRHLPSVNKDYILPKVYVPMGVASFLSATCIIIVLLVCCRRRRSRYSQLLLSSQRKGLTILHATPDECRFSDGKYFSFEGRYADWSHITVRRLKIGRLLGRGAFGNVHEGFAYGTGITDTQPLRVAIKRLKDGATEEERQAFKTELEQMRLLGNHTNIIGLVGSCILNGQMAILMEYAELGNLLSYLKEKSAKLENYVRIAPDGGIAEEQSRQITEETELMLFAWQIARGMAHLESLKCVHRDLASRNILIAEGPIAKISDFGLTRDVYENGYYFRASKGRLPYKWLSPEALLWGQYNTKSDVWSFGVLLWEIATLGGSPYPGVPADHMAELHRTAYRMPQPPNCPDKLYNIIQACWHEEPRQRPPFFRLTDILDTLLLGAAEREYLALESGPKGLLSTMDQEVTDQTRTGSLMMSDNPKKPVERITSTDTSDTSTSGYASSQNGSFYT